MAQTPTFVRWRVFVILAMASFVAYFLRSDISIAAPVMMLDLGLSEVEWGWVIDRRIYHELRHLTISGRYHWR